MRETRGIREQTQRFQDASRSRVIRSVCIGSCFLLLLGSVNAAQSRQGVIGGHVVHAITAEPVFARVTLVGLSQAGADLAARAAQSPNGGGRLASEVMNLVPAAGVAQATRGTTTVTVATGPDGAFTFMDVAPGNYRIMTEANGYVRQEYGQLTSSGPGSSIEVVPGQQGGDYRIRLVPFGVVTGRVVNEEGKPAMGTRVQLLSSRYTAQGQMFQVVAEDMADDRGEYRMPGVVPGRYYLVAGIGPETGRVQSGTSSTNANYALTYYPNAVTSKEASTIDVRPTENVLDLAVRSIKTYSIRGRVYDTSTGRPPTSMALSMVFRTFVGVGIAGVEANYSPGTGEFEVTDVLPGRYLLQGRLPTANNLGGLPLQQRLPINESRIEDGLISEVPVAVVNHDIEGLLITLSQTARIEGKVIIDGALVVQSSDAPSVTIQLRRSIDGSPTFTGTSPNVRSSTLDGTFRLDNLQPGQYSLGVQNSPRGMYLQTARLNGMDVAGKSFEVASDSNVLELQFRSKVARITGRVVDALNRPVRGAQVIAVPPDTTRLDLYRGAISTTDGQYDLTGLAPGMYWVFASGSSGMVQFFDPEFVDRFLSQGKSIRLTESGQETAELRLLKSDN